ncbi:MAG: S8 family serine peptidase, partial [Erysipelotrichales bacterium]
MKKFKVLIIALFIVLSVSINVDAKGKIKEDRLIISLNTTYNKNVKHSIEKKTNKKIIKTKKLSILGKNSYVFYFKGNLKDYTKTSKSLAKQSYVKKVQPSYIYKYKKGKNNVSTRATADYWHMDALKAHEMKNDLKRNNKVRVGILDTGIYYNHPDLKDKINKDLSYNFISNNKNALDVDGHGTHVAGVIGGNDAYATGKNVELVSYRVLSEFEESYTDTIIPAIEKANKDKLQVINMSIGTEPDMALNEAMENFNGLVVAAAGNDNSENIGYPAASDSKNIISVGASDKTGEKAKFSNYSKSDVDVFAPGSSIYSSCSISMEDCRINGIEADHDQDLLTSKLSGTSMASPLVAGIAASLLNENPNLTASELKNAIMDSVSPKDSYEGYAITKGNVDALKALEYSRKPKTNATHQASLENGKLSLWGNNNKGQLGNGNNNDLTKENAFIFEVSNDEISKYYLTKNNTFVVTKNGDLYVSGSNENNQLNQYKKGDTNTFVKFNKLDKNHKIVELDFRKNNGMLDEKTLVAKLSNKNYYTIGKEYLDNEINYLNIGFNDLVYVTKTKYKNIDKVLVYSEFSNSQKVSLTNKYYKINDEGVIYEFLEKSIERNNYKDNYTIKTISEDMDSEYEILIKYNYKNQKLTYLKKAYETYVFGSLNSSEEEVDKAMISKDFITYKNNKMDKRYIDYYNNGSQLKSNNYGNAYREYRKYDSQLKNISHYKAKYNSAGKLSKYQLTYNKKVSN